MTSTETNERLCKHGKRRATARDMDAYMGRERCYRAGDCDCHICSQVCWAGECTVPADIELVEGRRYRGKFPHVVGPSGEYDDRVILFMRDDRVIYTQPFMPLGRPNPETTPASFRVWASHEIRRNEEGV